MMLSFIRPTGTLVRSARVEGAGYDSSDGVRIWPELSHSHFLKTAVEV